MPSDETPGSAAVAMAESLRHLGPGPLAETRRMKPGTGSAVFWRLASRHPQIVAKHPESWMEIVRILALLTPRGAPERRGSLHDPRRRLGAVLCDGGDPGWTGPRPAFSPRRMDQLIAARGPRRAYLLQNAARLIASRRIPGGQVNVLDIARSLLFPRDGRMLAESYYGRLDRAEAAAAALEGEKTQ